MIDVIKNIVFGSFLAYATLGALALATSYDPFVPLFFIWFLMIYWWIPPTALTAYYVIRYLLRQLIKGSGNAN